MRGERRADRVSVTVQELLGLPSLRDARVLAGRGGLSRAVSSVSVLESVDPQVLVDNIFHNDEFLGSELVLTGFLNIATDVDRQCGNLRRLAEGGEAGLILYYVGVYMPRVDERLIRLADELDFPLICMPEGRGDLRYSEVICEVMERVVRSQNTPETLGIEILDSIARLPAHQQTVDTVLRVLSDRTHCTLVLRSLEQRVLNMAVWPRAFEPQLPELLRTVPMPPSGTVQTVGFQGRVLWARRDVLQTTRARLELLALYGGEAEPPAFARLAEVVQLAINLWNNRHGEVAVIELVRSILRDEPQKMYRLAALFGIDIVAINTMWIFRGNLGTAESAAVTKMARTCCSTAFADVYEGDLVLFMDDPHSLREADALAEELLQYFEAGGGSVALTRCHTLPTTTEVRAAFLLNQNRLDDARRLFPRRRSYSFGDLSFADDCCRCLEAGEAAVHAATASLDFLLREGEEFDLLGTLSAYLLDTDCSLQETAELLFVHKNTVKYRLGRISDRVGCRVGEMPATLPLARAVGIRRLMACAQNIEKQAVVPSDK